VRVELPPVLRALGGTATIPASRPCWRSMRMVWSVEAKPVCPYPCHGPVGLLMAVVGYVLGIYGAMVCAYLLGQVAIVMGFA
jgi:hypothetical protein